MLKKLFHFHYLGHNYHDHDHNYHNNHHATKYNYHRMGKSDCLKFINLQHDNLIQFVTSCLISCPYLANHAIFITDIWTVTSYTSFCLQFAKEITQNKLWLWTNYTCSAWKVKEHEIWWMFFSILEQIKEGHMVSRS